MARSASRNQHAPIDRPTNSFDRAASASAIAPALIGDFNAEKAGPGLLIGGLTGDCSVDQLVKQLPQMNHLFQGDATLAVIFLDLSYVFSPDALVQEPGT